MMWEKDKINVNYIDTLNTKNVTSQHISSRDDFININVLNESQINEIHTDIENKMVSYDNNINNILNQFYSDHNRSELYLNNDKINDPNDLNKQLLSFSRFKISLC